MLKTPANPGGLPIEVFDQLRAGVVADRSQFFMDLTMPFLRLQTGAEAKISSAVREVVLAAGDDGGLSGPATSASRHFPRRTSPRI